MAAMFAVPSWSGSPTTATPSASTAATPVIASALMKMATQTPTSIPQTRPLRTKSGATLPIPIEQTLKKGVLIVISKPSQQMYVFKDGDLWNSSPVSTGKKGKETPSGVFPILQKRRHHRSNLYSNAPMPYMQRMTWDGIAIHEGKLPGYPASHGCIRLPRDFASALFKLSSKDTTTVVVTDSALTVARDARRLALRIPMPKAGKNGKLIQAAQPKLADLGAPTPTATDPALEGRVAARVIERRPPSGPTQTIQLIAAGSAAAAEAHWTKIKSRFPQLSGYEKKVIPAVVNSRKVYRLRVTGPAAKATCNTLRKAGSACFPVK
ncbi:MAG: L,D-transpeptidase family protein [Pseudomonadota bacterium]